MLQMGFTNSSVKSTEIANH